MHKLLAVKQLRPLVRKAGWRGTSVLDANKGELLHFLETGERPTRSIPVSSGRPSVMIPDDLSSLLYAIRQAHRTARAFYRTGSKGVHARREELPAAFQDIGRDRMERLIVSLIKAGRIVTDGAALVIPKISNDQQEV